MTENDELLDLVDASDNVIGTIRRGDTARLKPNESKYIRSVNVFIVRPTGEIWVPKRSATKTLAPNGLDYGIGGHVNSTESYLECAVREAYEEARLRIKSTDLQLITKTTPHENGTHYFNELYCLATDSEPRLSNEHTSGNWMAIDQLIEILHTGVPAKSSLLQDCVLLKQFLAQIHPNNA